MTTNKFEEHLKQAGIVLQKTERVDELQYKGLLLIQDKTKYCFTSDAVLLANFAKGKKKQVLVDLCSGIGPVATLVLAKNNLKMAYGVELQTPLFELAQKSAKLNHLEDKLQFINSPVQEVSKHFAQNSIDIVTANPPYESPRGHYLSTDEQMNACKYETHLSLEELIASASYLLKFGGKFFLVHKSSRIAEIIALLKKYKLEPKVLRFVQPKISLNSNVVLIEAVAGGKEGALVLPNLVLNNADGTFTDEIKKLYEEKT